MTYFSSVPAAQVWPGKAARPHAREGASRCAAAPMAGCERSGIRGPSSNGKPWVRVVKHVITTLKSRQWRHTFWEVYCNDEMK